MNKNYPKRGIPLFTLEDLIEPRLREMLDRVDLRTNEDRREVIQGLLSFTATTAIRQLHIVLCNSDACVFDREESHPDCWVQPAHIEYADLLIHVMNECEISLGEWPEILASYIKVMKIVGKQPKLNKLLLTINLEPQKFIDDFHGSKLITFPLNDLRRQPQVETTPD